MVLIVDYGSQYTELLSRLVRELGNRVEVVRPDSEFPQGVDAIILSGGPESVYEENAPDLPVWILESGIPIMGICYGMQLIVRKLGGVVKRGKAEYGEAKVRLKKSTALTDGLPDEFRVWMSHGDEVVEVPAGFEILGTSDDGVISVIAKDQIVGLQFHPEVHHTEHGRRIVENFLRNIAKLERDWSPENVLEEKIKWIAKTVGDEKVIGAVSGGVDSTVAAVLASRAIGRNFLGIFVDTGFLRKGERKRVTELLKNLGVNFEVVNAQDEFFRKLQGVVDPEQKRKIIGETFVEIFERVARNRGAAWLLQGTIQSDVAESGGGKRARIKSHHNVGGLPRNMRLKLLEPLRDLFKDEVREIGKALGIPENILKGHPFPGPGLAVRIPGEVTRYKIEILRKADDIFISILKERGWYDKLWQAFAVLLPVRTTGVKGDSRDYGYAVVLRAVMSREGMTAKWVRLPHDLLDTVSKKITREVEGITRVLYDITDKPPATIEWE